MPQLELTSRSVLPLTPNPLLSPAVRPIKRTVGAIKGEMQALPHLTADSRYCRREAKARLVDARQAKSAADSLDHRLPDDGEGVHIIVSGRHSLGDYIPAIHQIAGCPIAELYVITLGFSRRNVIRWCEMIDAGAVGNLRLLFSHYFRGTSPQLTELADVEFAKRPDRMQLLSLRSHCKILLFALADGRTVEILSSANARSCDNLENVSVYSDPGLYQFNRAWVDDLFARANDGAKEKTA